jgi:hypothetical protein
MPIGAKCQTTPNAEGREMPESAPTTEDNCTPFALCVIGALSGISRNLAFRALRHLAPFGISRCYCPAPFGFCAVRVLRRSGSAPFGFCAVS